MMGKITSMHVLELSPQELAQRIGYIFHSVDEVKYDKGLWIITIRQNSKTEWPPRGDDR